MNQDYIYKIDRIINKAVKEIKIANAKRMSAEKISMTLQEDIKKAYMLGFKEGFKKAIQSSSGGTSKSKDENRLVLKNS